MKENTYYVYILASQRNGTLYIGVTNDLLRRIGEHQQNIIDGFTKKYKVHHLVWYEEFNDVTLALEKEKQIKKWKRGWKLQLIERNNPTWSDLSSNFAY